MWVCLIAKVTGHCMDILVVRNCYRHSCMCTVGGCPQPLAISIVCLRIRVYNYRPSPVITYQDQLSRLNTVSQADNNRIPFACTSGTPQSQQRTDAPIPNQLSFSNAQLSDSPTQHPITRVHVPTFTIKEPNHKISWNSLAIPNEYAIFGLDTWMLVSQSGADHNSSAVTPCFTGFQAGKASSHRCTVRISQSCASRINCGSAATFFFFH